MTNDILKDKRIIPGEPAARGKRSEESLNE
jgi:hypothetical protein